MGMSSASWVFSLGYAASGKKLTSLLSCFLSKLNDKSQMQCRLKGHSAKNAPSDSYSGWIELFLNMNLADC